ncbi:MAG: MFS transporter [Candidatus Sungiibacteriota bacterium]|uniref:MFS transporter n=1 Tax=Candidatus Sungiibacteriota bacterium TaxID=2750080 RepID=A0A7T5RIU0_9BACT|nr:MAG: MFS transporter [Candidatus Sungbacteria bacterium]
MNLVIQSLIFASFIFETGFGLLSPIFAVFVTQQVGGGDVTVVGIAAGVYWILKSILQVPVGRFLDKKQGEDDDFWALFAGHFLMGLTVFLYQFARTPIHIYMLQGLLAIGGALLVPSWYAMFLRHVDKHKEGFEWSINSSLSYGLGTGGAGVLGGFLAKAYGFNFIFVTGAILVWASLLMLLVLRRNLRNHQLPPIPKAPSPVL